jgi:hypothetical protein
MVKKKRSMMEDGGWIDHLSGRRVRWLIVALMFSVADGNLHGQEIRATAKVDSNNISIGDWLKLHLEVEHPANVSVAWPQLADSLQGFEVIQRSEHSTQQSGQNLLESAVFTITAYDSGTFVVPPLPFQYVVQGDTTKKVVETSPILVTVHGIPVDTTKDIRDIKPPLSPSIAFSEILPYLIAVVVLGGIVWLLYYIHQKRKRGESLLPEVPARPAGEVALEALRALEAERLWQRGKIKEYHSQLTDIVRVYIERRFNVMAMELTSDEILSTRQIEDLESGMREKLREILFRADLVKFAKFQPQAGENESSMALAISFVETTWRALEREPLLQQTPAEVEV